MIHAEWTTDRIAEAFVLATLFLLALRAFGAFLDRYELMKEQREEALATRLLNCDECQNRGYVVVQHADHDAFELCDCPHGRELAHNQDNPA
jgi:hypothetical protein